MKQEQKVESLYNCNSELPPQMTRFRDEKVCNNWLQVRIDDDEKVCNNWLQVRIDGHRIPVWLQVQKWTTKSRWKEIYTWYYVCVVDTARHQWQRDHQDLEHFQPNRTWNTDTWVRSSLCWPGSCRHDSPCTAWLKTQVVLRMSSHPRMWWAFLLDLDLHSLHHLPMHLLSLALPPALPWGS